MKKVFIIFLLWLLIVNVFALLVLNRFNLKPDTAYNWINPSDFSQEKTWDLVSIHSRWDSFWYLDIAKNGYSYQEGELSNIVFFPIYPILMRFIAVLVGGNFVLAGWLLSTFFLFLSVLYFFKLVKEFHPEVDPYLPIVFLLIFPSAFFLNAVYTESLFLFLSLATFYYILKKNYFLAGVLGLLASLSRVTGILLFIPFFWEYFKNNKFNLKSFLSLKILPIFLVLLGTFGFFFFHYLKFGDPILFLKVEASWGRMFKLNGEHFQFLNNAAITNFCLDFFFVIFAIIIIYFIFKKLKISYGLYTAATLFIALSTGTLMSVGRYILVLFPMYIFLASIKNQYIQQVWIFLSTLLLALYIILFVNNYWAG